MAAASRSRFAARARASGERSRIGRAPGFVRCGDAPAGRLLRRGSTGGGAGFAGGGAAGCGGGLGGAGLTTGVGAAGFAGGLGGVRGTGRGLGAGSSTSTGGGIGVSEGGGRVGVRVRTRPSWWRASRSWPITSGSRPRACTWGPSSSVPSALRTSRGMASWMGSWASRSTQMTGSRAWSSNRETKLGAVSWAAAAQIRRASRSGSPRPETRPRWKRSTRPSLTARSMRASASGSTGAPFAKRPSWLPSTVRSTPVSSWHHTRASMRRVDREAAGRDGRDVALRRSFRWGSNCWSTPGRSSIG
ncbi:MAG: hypothetical protein H6739_14245 [Alphaproteobacteria bacterium]|nr:hypothetical protein [Alphaproteobacteria bacterium]